MMTFLSDLTNLGEKDGERVENQCHDFFLHKIARKPIFFANKTYSKS
jgi:hypothetical protein